VAALALVIIVPAALVVGALTAVWPAQRVARMRPADVLRSE
jgi:ABC-type antimicrobial peptide transport system permease subunit